MSKTVLEKNLASPLNSVITDLKTVPDDYTPQSNEIEGNVKLPLRDENGYRYIADSGTVRLLGDSESPRAETIANNPRKLREARNANMITRIDLIVSISDELKGILKEIVNSLE